MSGVKVTNERSAGPIPAVESVDGEVDGDNVDWEPGESGTSELDQWKQPARVATTANITIATALNAGDAIDAVTLVAGDRVLVKDQAAAEDNGIYVAGATPERAVDMDDDDEVLGAVVYVIAGAVNGGTTWAVTNTAATVVDTDAIDWAAIAGGGSGSLALDDLTDVTITAPADGEVLTYDSGSGEWVNAPAAAGTPDAIDVAYDNSSSGLDGEDVQAAIDELAGALGWAVDTVGSISETSSPQTILDDATWNEFPGLIRLDPGRVLTVFRGNGTDHVTDGQLSGIIGTLSATRDSVTWGSRFLILDDTNDLRGEDFGSIIDGQIVVAYREYNGSANVSPQLIICDDAPEDFTAASTWSSPIAIPLTTGSVQNYTQGHVHKLGNGTFIMGVGWQGAGTHTVGVAKWSGTVDDPSAATFVTVGSGVNDYAEIALEVLDDGTTVRAHIRTAAGTSHYQSVSTDSGATWSAPSIMFTAEGYPAFRQLLSGLSLSVYRHSPNGDTAWRATTDSTDSTWGSETILDTTGTRSAYATLLQVTPTNILCVYAVEYSAGGTTGTADLFAQWFTDSSTFDASIPEPVATAHIADTTDAHHASAVSVADAGGYYTGTDVEAALQEAGSTLASLGAATSSAGFTDHFHVIEAFNGDGAITAFTIADEPMDPDAVFAFVGGSLTAVTVSGTDNTTVTFGSAPGAGTANVVINYPALVLA